MRCGCSRESLLGVREWKTHNSLRGEYMKITLNILGIVLVLFGTIWFLQGINLLPGSFMTGQIRWAVYGGIAVAAGIALLVISKRRRLDGTR